MEINRQNLVIDRGWGWRKRRSQRRLPVLPQARVAWLRHAQGWCGGFYQLYCSPLPPSQDNVELCILHCAHENHIFPFCKYKSALLGPTMLSQTSQSNAPSMVRAPSLWPTKNGWWKGKKVLEAWRQADLGSSPRFLSDSSTIGRVTSTYLGFYFFFLKWG